MKKISMRTALVALGLVGVLFLSGCGMIQMDQERDYNQTVATVNGVAIKKAALIELYESNLDMYEQYYGMTFDETVSEDRETLESIKTSCLDQLIRTEVVRQQIEKGGYNNLTDAEKKEIKDKMDADMYEQIDQRIDSLDLQYGVDESGKRIRTKEEVREYAFEIFFDNSGYTYDSYLEGLYEAKAEEKWRDELLKDVTVSEDEISKKYTTLMTEQKTSFADEDSGVSNYETAVNNGDPVVYNLPGYIRVQNLLIKIPDSATTNITSLRESGDEEGADAALKTALAAIESEAKKVLEKAKSAGTDFDELLKQETDDTGMKDEETRKLGYLVGPNTTSYVTEFQKAAIALKKVGDISELVATDYGYHIIKKIKDVPAGEVKLEDAKEDIKAAVLEEKRTEAEEERVDKMVEEAKVEKNKRALKIHKYKD